MRIINLKEAQNGQFESINNLIDWLMADLDAFAKVEFGYVAMFKYRDQNGQTLIEGKEPVAIRSWLDQNLRSSNFRWIDDPFREDLLIYFRNEEDMVAFKMKWY